MKNLISMVDFVLMQEIKIECQSLTEQWSSRVSRYNKIMAYANLLKQPLDLWMFVPCKLVNGVWVVLEKTIIEKYQFGENEIGIYEIHSLEYEQAKERCLFVWQKGFDYKVICEMFKDLEDIILFEFELTKTAQKQIFG